MQSGTSGMTALSPAADGWRALDAVLDDVERLAGQPLSDPEFWDALLDRLTPLGFVHTAFWRLAPDEPPQLLRERGRAAQGNGQVRPPVLNREALRDGLPVWLDDGASVVVPIRKSDAAAGALVLEFAHAIAPTAREGFERWLAALVSFVEAFLLRQSLRTTERRLAQQHQRDDFLLAIHGGTDVTETAYRLANDGRLLLGCDRVAVALPRGGRFRVRAVSGAEHVERRSPSIRPLERLVTLLARLGQPFWHDGPQPDLPGPLADALADYLDASPALALAVIPLLEPVSAPRDGEVPSASRRCVGVLVCEQFTQPFAPDIRQAIDELREHCAAAVQHAARWRAVPMRRLWQSLARPGGAWRSFGRMLLLVVVLAALVVPLFVVETELRITARGALQPVERREVFAPVDSVVKQVLVGHGQRVAAGDLLVELRSAELDRETERLQGTLETTRKQLAAVQSERLQTRPGDADARLRQRRLTAEEEQLQEQLRGIEAQQALLAEERQALRVTSPVAGDVLTWNLQQRLMARPLRRGDALLTVANVDGPWQLELHVPARHAGFVLAAAETPQREVAYVLTASPAIERRGVLSRVAQRMETDDTGASALRITVSIDSAEAPHTPGAAAVAHVPCGRHCLGYVWFRDLIDAARTWW